MKSITITSAFFVALCAIGSSQTKPTKPSLGVFELTKYERIEVYAGKLGNRVKETLTLKRDGKTFTLGFYRYHTRVDGKTITPFCPGCTVEVKKGSIKGSVITAERGDVVQIHDKMKKGDKSHGSSGSL